MPESINMEEVVRTLALPFKLAERDTYHTCPVCGKKEKLNIDPKGVFHCVCCGFSGTAFDLWAYYRGISSPDRKELCRLVAKDFYSFTGGAAEGKRETREEKKHEVKVFDAASEDVLDDTYRGLLSHLSLSDTHRQALRRRGLPDEIIDANGYKTAPVVGNRQLAHKVLSEGRRAEGVPGFMKYSGWTFRNHGPGFLIPCKSVNGRIHGLQIRTDRRKYRRSRSFRLLGSLKEAKKRLRPAKGGLRRRPKYMTISSKGKPFGTAGFSKPHYNPGWDGSSEVILTEGPLKGDIISMFTGKASLSLLGVNNLAYVPSMLRELRGIGKTKISIAYDMDMHDPGKEGVRRGLAKIERCLVHEGFRYDRRDWKEEYERFGLKGYDDYLLFCFQGK